MPVYIDGHMSAEPSSCHKCSYYVPRVETYEGDSAACRGYHSHTRLFPKGMLVTKERPKWCPAHEVK